MVGVGIVLEFDDGFGAGDGCDAGESTPGVGFNDVVVDAGADDEAGTAEHGRRVAGQDGLFDAAAGAEDAAFAGVWVGHGWCALVGELVVEGGAGGAGGDCFDNAQPGSFGGVIQGVDEAWEGGDLLVFQPVGFTQGGNIGVVWCAEGLFEAGLEFWVADF